jgi:hypothetical protein
LKPARYPHAVWGSGRFWRPGAAVLLGAALALAATAGARAGDCLRFEPEEETLAGTLRLEVMPGPPHYTSFDTGDRPESIWLLALAKPVCIDAAPGDGNNKAAAQVDVVQIIPRAAFSVDYNGKVAHVRGTLYRPRGGHPRAQVLLRATSVTPESR